MTRTWRLFTTAAFCVVSAAATGRAQQNASIEPEAMTALTNMGTYLRSLKSFQVDAVTSAEDVLDDGQKVQFDGVTRLLARMPDRLLISVTSDRQDRDYVYDGKTFTMLAKRLNYYATVAAPPTIAQLADALDDQYGLNLPLEDLFRWGGPQSKDDAITSALFIGPSAIDGVTCGHYAFRQDGLDWQVWIQMGDYPLPRKLVLTTKTDEARPQYVATFTWNLAPSFNDEAFTFVPPKGVGRAVFDDLKKVGASR
jgi:hypothetical protein